MGRVPAKAVFLDRDDTISRDVPYCSRPEDLELLPMAAQAIRLLNENGFTVVVVTNQSGIARGYFTEETLGLIHQKMRRDLEAQGAFIDAIYYCPHHPDEGCECRKPSPTMVLQAARELDIELAQSYVIGDSEMDVEMGRRAGCKTVLVSPAGEATAGKQQADFVAGDIYQAASWVISTGTAETA